MQKNIPEYRQINRPLQKNVCDKIAILHKINNSPFATGCIIFIIIKIAYLAVGYYRGLNVRHLEGLARLYYSYYYKGTGILENNNPCLPLPPAIMTLAILPSTYTLLMSSILQTVISISGGIMAALLAMEIYGNNSWRAGLATLTAWVGSDAITILGIGYLSEPLFHLEIFALLYCSIKWMRSGEAKWRTWTLLSIFALQLSRYEGWILIGFYTFILSCLIIDSRRHNTLKDYKGLWNFSTGDFFIFIAFISIMPLSWIILNWILKGDPLFFVKCTKEVFKANIGMNMVEKNTAYLDYLHLTWEMQPLIITIAATVLVTPRIFKGPAFILILTISCLTFFNLYCILNETTAFAYPERLSSSLFIIFCPLFGVMTEHFFRFINKTKNLKRFSSFIYFFLLLLLIVTGANHFRSRNSNLYDNMGMDIVKVLKKEFKKCPEETEPIVLLEYTKTDFSIILFYINMDSSKYYCFNRNDDVSSDEILKNNPSIRFLLMNHNQENVAWVMKQEKYHLRISSYMWDLYEAR
jgi:hypothetical protein